MRRFILLWVPLVLLPFMLFSLEVVNEVLVVIKDKVITTIDIEERLEIDGKRSNLKDKALKEKILDRLVQEQIIEVVAEQESVTVSQERIENAIKMRMESAQIKDPKKYEELLKKETGMDMDTYKAEVEKQLKREDVMRLRVPMKMPTQEEIDAWYKKNKNKIGKKFTFRLVERRFKPNNIVDEDNVNQMMKKAHALAQKNFADAVKQYSDHPSRVNGGLFTEQRIDEIVKIDTTVAGLVNNTKQGTMSPLMRSPERNSYMFVKVEKSFDIPQADVAELIQRVLLVEGQESAFREWIETEKRKMGIKIKPISN